MGGRIPRRHGEAYRQQHGASLSTAQRRAMTAIELCRTSALGGHVERCDSCGHQRVLVQQLPIEVLPILPITRPGQVVWKTARQNSSTPNIST